MGVSNPVTNGEIRAIACSARVDAVARSLWLATAAEPVAAGVVVPVRVTTWLSFDFIRSLRLVAKPGSSIRVRSPIGSGSAVADEMFLFS